jgi:SAM-dependent methyltransferase
MERREMSANDSYNRNAADWAQRMRAGRNLAHTYLEKPAMYRKLPKLRKKTVLCLGCGSGEECVHLLSLGAKKVVGIDRAAALITLARQSCPQADFRVMDMQRMKFQKSSFDLVYSSLAMHYLQDWRPTLKSIHAALKPRGRFLFSTHHPACWSAEILPQKRGARKLLGYSTANGRPKQIWGDYQRARKVKDVWFGNMEVSFYHKPLENIFNEIHESGFTVADFVEPKPLPALKKVSAAHYALFSRIPLFVTMELEKR